MKTFTDFRFQMETEIVFGSGAESQAGSLIRKYGGTKVMLVYGSGSIQRSGLYDRVTAALREAGLPFVDMGGVQANPRKSFVEEGIRIAKKERPDFFLGVGGGSVLDTAKALALAAANDWTFWQFWQGTEPLAMAPVGSIHTISAAGSETSRSSVLVDDLDTGMKFGFNWDVCRPRFAIMNPLLTCTLPPLQTASGAADIFAHTFMRFFCESDSYLGDHFAASVLKTVLRYGPVALRKPEDYEARAELMLAGAFSHNDLTGIGRACLRRGGEHPLEHQLSGHYDTPHGAGLAVIMPALLSYFIRHGDAEQVARVAQFAVLVFDVEPDLASVEETAQAGVEALKTWLRSMGLPVTLKELGVPKEELNDAIDRCVKSIGGYIPGYMGLDEVAIDEIYRSAFE